MTALYIAVIAGIAYFVIKGVGDWGKAQKVADAVAELSRLAFLAGMLAWLLK